LKMPRRKLLETLAHAEAYNRFKKSLLKGFVSTDIYYGLQEQLWKYKGIYIDVRNTRNYTYPVGANYLGYISEVNEGDLAADGYYKSGDLIGKTGIERRYEKLLRGKKGVKHIIYDVHQREVGAFRNGELDTIPQKGEDLMISVDVKLQQLGEEIMANKLGSIVAIEPSSGEILAFVSAPTYNPNYLVGKQKLIHYFRLLRQDTLNPLFNRPLQAKYPPGSIFKVLNALIALNEETLTPQMRYPCAGYFARSPIGRPKCHAHPGPLSVDGAIQYSCNAFFAGVYVDYMQNDHFQNVYRAYDTWYDYMQRFGAGIHTGIDIPNETRGNIPSSKLYDKWYRHNRWNGMTIVSNAIGQGEVLMTPLQMANAMATIANRGYYIEPHFFRKLLDPNTRQTAPQFRRHETGIARKHFDLVADAMAKVVSAGTGVWAQVEGIEVAGKTGTAENPHGEDHSVFIAFAPKDNPKIAIAVIVENAGFGGEMAAPITKLMLEQYLKGAVKDKALLTYLKEKDYMAPYKRPDYSEAYYQRQAEEKARNKR
ncbi:MAG: penicillin-binding transpeptidase domain-containing protein, partial [Sphingobacteriia bacterium]